MKPEGVLRRRLAVAFAGLCLAVTSLIPYTFWVTDSLLEQPVIVDLIGYHLVYLTHSEAKPFEVHTARSGMRYYRPRLSQEIPLPPEFAALSPGIYHEFRLGDEILHLQVREAARGDRAYLAYDIAFVQRLGRQLLAFVLALTLVVGAGVWVFGRHLVDRALRPLHALLEQVRGLDPERPGQRLSVPASADELNAIATALNQHMRQRDALVERERAFAAAAGHELRTPLSVIQGDIELLQQIPQVPERARSRLQRAVQDLRFNLDALLALSHTGQQARRERLCLNDWLPREAETHCALLKAPVDIRWQLDVRVELQAPPGAVNVIFGNLLRNALRVSQRIDIRLLCDRLELRDYGPGIAEDLQEQLFEPGFRGPDGGSGMGLYIAANVARHWGWQLELRNAQDGGALAVWRFA